MYVFMYLYPYTHFYLFSAMIPSKMLSKTFAYQSVPSLLFCPCPNNDHIMAAAATTKYGNRPGGTLRNTDTGNLKWVRREDYIHF